MLKLPLVEMTFFINFILLPITKIDTDPWKTGHTVVALQVYNMSMYMYIHIDHVVHHCHTWLLIFHKSSTVQLFVICSGHISLAVYSWRCSICDGEGGSGHMPWHTPHWPSWPFSFVKMADAGGPTARSVGGSPVWFQVKVGGELVHGGELKVLSVWRVHPVETLGQRERESGSDICS